jgi:uncharacterized protein YyaL (SSP411 family)
MLSGYGTLIGAVAVVYGATQGFKQWREQKLAERRMQLAEQILALAYKMREIMKSIRSGGSFRSEHDAAEKILRDSDTVYDGMDEGEKSRLIQAQVTLTRVQNQAERWDQLLDILPVTKAVFDDEIEKALSCFWLQRAAVVAAVRTYGAIKDTGPARSEEEANRRDETLRNLERTFWDCSVPPEVDEVEEAINAGIATLDEELLPIIRKGHGRSRSRKKEGIK